MGTILRTIKQSSSQAHRSAGESVSASSTGVHSTEAAILLSGASLEDSARADGLTQANAAIVCAFQAQIERSANCDYDAMRAALQWARINPALVSKVALERRYTEAQYNALGIARIG